MNNKINIKTFAGILLGIIAVAVFQHYVFPSLFSPSFDSQIMHFASEINKNCPIMVDSETKLDGAIAGEGKSIQYSYTLINYKKDEINLDYFQANLKPVILNTIKTHADMKSLRENDVTFVYSYRDKEGVYITSLKFEPKDYNM